MKNAAPAAPSPSASSLGKRIVSGLVLAPLTLFVIHAGGWLFFVLVTLAALLALYEFTALVERDRYRLILLPFGLIYLTISCAAFIFLRFGAEQGPLLAMALMICVWASDIGAYVTGKTIGGARMAPRLSPNKTWAGLAGASFFCGAALALLAAFASGMSDQLPAWPLAFVAGCLFGLVGQAGDLLVSYFKRRAAVKDTGALIPGHGGLLDRIDALLLVSPIFSAIVLLCL